MRSAEKGEDVRLPRHLPVFLKATLVTVDKGALVVVRRLPPVPDELRWRFPPALAAEHNTLLKEVESR
jgi:hypothetical protein